MSDARKTVWIAWNEAMTQGIVLTDKQQADELRDGKFTEDDLTHAFCILHPTDVITVDAVSLEMGRLN